MISTASLAEAIEEMDGDFTDYYEGDGGEIEWLDDLSYIPIMGTDVPISFKGVDSPLGDLLTLGDTPGYCGGILVGMKEATEENMREFVAFLAEKTPYSQLLCGDVTNKIFLSLGAINLGGFLLLEVK